MDIFVIHHLKSARKEPKTLLLQFFIFQRLFVAINIELMFYECTYKVNIF